MIEFLANLLSNAAQRSGYLGLAVAEMALIFRLLLIPSQQSYYKSTLLADSLQERVDAIYKKEKDAAEAGRKVTKLLAQVRYPSLGMVVYLVIFGALSLLLAWPLSDMPERFREAGTFSCAFPGLVPDVTQSPYGILSAGQQSAGTMAAFLLPVLAAGATYLHDRAFANHSVVVRQNFDFIALIAITAGSVFLPAGFSICWLIVELVGIIQCKIVRRFFHVKIKDRPEKKI